MLRGCGDAVLEQRWFFHRSIRSLVVYELQVLPSSITRANEARASACAVTFSGCNMPAAHPNRGEGEVSTRNISRTLAGVITTLSAITEPETAAGSPNTSVRPGLSAPRRSAAKLGGTRVWPH